MDFVDLQVEGGVLKVGRLEGRRCDSGVGSPGRMEVLPQLRRLVSLVFCSAKGRKDFRALAGEMARRKIEGVGRKPRRRHRLKLVFGSQRGREGYKRVVRGVRSRRVDGKSI